MSDSNLRRPHGNGRAHRYNQYLPSASSNRLPLPNTYDTATFRSGDQDTCYAAPPSASLSFTPGTEQTYLSQSYMPGANPNYPYALVTASTHPSDLHRPAATSTHPSSLYGPAVPTGDTPGLAGPFACTPKTSISWMVMYPGQIRRVNASINGNKALENIRHLNTLHENLKSLMRYADWPTKHEEAEYLEFQEFNGESHETSYFLPSKTVLADISLFT